MNRQLEKRDLKPSFGWRSLRTKIIAVSVYVEVFVALAIWRFNREEF